MTRGALIEQILRQVYNGQPSDDSGITPALVSLYVNQGLAIAAKQNYKDNLTLEGVGFVNNSFFTTFKGIAITPDEQFLYKFPLPNIPLGIGATEGISRVVFKDAQGNVSLPGIILSEFQVALHRNMRSVPNKICVWPEGGECFVSSTLIMTQYTASVTLISGGGTSMDSTMNVPDDAIPVIFEYVKAQLVFQRNQVVNAANDGQDGTKVA